MSYVFDVRHVVILDAADQLLGSIVEVPHLDSLQKQTWTLLQNFDPAIPNPIKFKRATFAQIREVEEAAINLFGLVVTSYSQDFDDAPSGLDNCEIQSGWRDRARALLGASGIPPRPYFTGSLAIPAHVGTMQISPNFKPDPLVSAGLPWLKVLRFEHGNKLYGAEIWCPLGTSLAGGGSIEIKQGPVGAEPAFSQVRYTLMVAPA